MTTAYDAAVAADSPVAWWKLNDAAGSSVAADSSGNGYTGTATSVTFGGIAGQLSAQFTGKTNCGIVTTYTPPALSAFTIECWINLDGIVPTSGFPQIFSNANSSSNHLGFQLYMGGSNYIPVINLGNGTTYTGYSFGSALPTSGWVHLVSTYDGAHVINYRNGVQVSSTALTGSVPASGVATLGTNIGSNANQYAGAIAEAAIYTTALSATRVSAHYSAFAATTTGTQNLCVNPSFEASIAGWNALPGATIAQDAARSLKGQQSLLVTTAGAVPGEGFYGPASALTGTVISGSPTAFWTAQNGQIAITSNLPGDAPVTTAVQFTNIAGVQGYAIQNGGPSVNVPVTHGNSYTVYGWVYNPDTNGDAKLGLAWDDGTTTTNVIDVTPGEWEYVSTTVTAPADVTAHANIVFSAGTTDAYSMYASLQVQAAGAATTGAVSGSLFSASDASGNTIGGTVLVAAVDMSGNILSQNNVTLTGAYTPFSLAGFAVGAGVAFRLLVATQTQQALQFWLDAVQYETGVTNSSRFIDGDTPGCSWVGTPDLSASQQVYQNVITAKGFMNLVGVAAPVIVGLPNYLSAKGFMTLGGKLRPASGIPTAAFADFGIFELTDPDPAQTYCDWNNTGTNTGTSPSYANNYSIFYPPLDYPVSSGSPLWKRAAFMGVGLYFTGVPAAGTVNVTDAQVTLAPLVPSGSPTVPNFSNPRQIETIIGPTRLNYCTNPSFSVSTAGWTALGAATLALDSSTVPSPEYNTLLQLQNLPQNNAGISTDGTGTGNFDGFGSSYSATAMAGAGFGLYAENLVGGIQYNMPDVQAGAPDNVICMGQTITVSDSPGATYVGFLGASAGESGGAAGASGNVTFTYSDGTTSTQFLGLSDWTLSGGAAQVSYGNQIAASMTYRNVRAQFGYEQTVQTYLFTALLPLTAGKKLVSITLPNNANMHVFAISTASVQANTSFGTTACNVKVTANGDGLKISVPDLIVGDPYTVSVYLEAGQWLSGITAQMAGGANVVLSNATGGVPYGGTAGIGYGQGPYGGVTGTGVDITQSVWYRVNFTFTATTSSDVLSVTATTGTDFPGGGNTTNFWIDAILIEAGEVLLPYFDGGFGSAQFLDYQWEGTAGLSRSYYYEQFRAKTFTLSEVLSQHVPLGIGAASPVYLFPPTQ